MAESGTFNISRAIWNHPAFKPEPFTEREAFIWMISEAEWKPRTKRVGGFVVNLDRGQLAASLRFMADAWRWKKDRVKRFMLRCTNRDTIATATATGVFVITICNYDLYQNEPSDNATGNNSKPRRDRDRTATNLIREEGKKKGESKTREARISASSFPSFIRPEVAQGYLDFRRSKRNPVSTKRVMDLLARDLSLLRDEGIDPNAALDTAMARGWQGFRPKWIRNDATRQRTNGDGRPSRTARLVTLALREDERAENEPREVQRQGSDADSPARLLPAPDGRGPRGDGAGKLVG